MGLLAFEWEGGEGGKRVGLVVEGGRVVRVLNGTRWFRGIEVRGRWWAS